MLVPLSQFTPPSPPRLCPQVRFLCQYLKKISNHWKVPWSLLYCPIPMLQEGIWFRPNHLEGSGALESSQRALEHWGASSYTCHKCASRPSSMTASSLRVRVINYHYCSHWELTKQFDKHLYLSALGLCCCAQAFSVSSCGRGSALRCGGFSGCRAWALGDSGFRGVGTCAQ